MNSTLSFYECWLGTIRGGGEPSKDTQALLAVMELFELFAFRGRRDAKTSPSCQVTSLATW